MTGVKIFVVGVEFYQPLLNFVKERLLRDKMIDAADVEMIHLTDDLNSIVLEIDNSLSQQICLLEEAGLEDSKYYKSLAGFNRVCNVKKQ